MARSVRIREEFANFFRPYARREHGHSIFFSDQLLRTLLAFDLLNPGQRKGVSQCHARSTPYLQITIQRESTATRPLGPPKTRMGKE